MKKYITLLFLAVLATTATAQKALDNESGNSASMCDEANTTLKSLTSYYYFPNMQVYFDIEKKRYHYQLGKDWIVSEELPQYYGGYSLFKNERVLVTIANDEEPQIHIKEHHKEFPYNPKGRIKRPLQTLNAENSTVSIE